MVYSRLLSEIEVAKKLRDQSDVGTEVLSSTEAIQRPDQRGIDWSTYAEVYDAIPDLIAEYRENLELVRSFLEPTFSGKSPRILDAGAGTGNYICNIAKYLPAASFWHVDASAAMTQRARAKYQEKDIPVTVVEKPIQDTEFDPDYFDAIVCVNALYAMAPQAETLDKFRKWLSPDGLLCVIDFGRTQKVSDWFAGFVSNALRGKVSGTALRTAVSKGPGIVAQGIKGRKSQTEGNYWRHSTSEFTSTLEQSGFSILQSGTCYRTYCDFAFAKISV